MKKSLGQYFLRCPWVVSTMLNAAEIKKTDTVLEIGPGAGALTRTLAQCAERVIAVEKDERLAADLAATLRNENIDNVTTIPGDILSNLETLATAHKLQTTSYKLVSNIPYYLTSRLLRLLIEEGPRPKLIVFTIQKEVAERIIAQPPQMNLLALSVQAFGTPRIVKEIPATCFSPNPKVDSAIIQITNISPRLFAESGITPQQFFAVTRRAFSQKRKLLTNSLAALLPSLPRPGLVKMFAQTHISPMARPQELSLTQWFSLLLRLNFDSRVFRSRGS